MGIDDKRMSDSPPLRFLKDLKYLRYAPQDRAALKELDRVERENRARLRQIMTTHRTAVYQGFVSGVTFVRIWLSSFPCDRSGQYLCEWLTSGQIAVTPYGERRAEAASAASAPAGAARLNRLATYTNNAIFEMWMGHSEDEVNNVLTPEWSGAASEQTAYAIEGDLLTLTRNYGNDGSAKDVLEFTMRGDTIEFLGAPYYFKGGAKSGEKYVNHPNIKAGALLYKTEAVPAPRSHRKYKSQLKKLRKKT